MVIEHARQGDDPGSNPPTFNFVTLCFSVFSLFENNSKCLGDALSLTACIFFGVDILSAILISA